MGMRTLYTKGFKDKTRNTDECFKIINGTICIRSSRHVIETLYKDWWKLDLDEVILSV